MSLRRCLLEQQAAASSSDTSREEEPNGKRKRKRKASPEPTKGRKRAKLVPEEEAEEEPNGKGKRKRKASPEPTKGRKRAKLVPEEDADTSSEEGTKRRKKIRGDGEGPQKRTKKTKKSLRRRLLGKKASSSSATTSKESSSDPLEGCSPQGRKRKAADVRGCQPDSVELSKVDQRAEFDSKYKQQKQLGEGGCGSVFAGLRKSDGLPVAIKHVPKDKVICKHVDHNGRKLSIEVAAMLKIQDDTAESVGASVPIGLLDWYDLDQELILILERPVPSEDLFDYVENNGGLLQEEEAKIIVKQLLEAAIHLENKGIFHRDIKCENILIELGLEVPRMRLLDFGLCTFTKERSFYRSFYGTVQHAPPEFYCCQKYRAGPTTVFQVGVVLFDMLHRKYKFETTMYFGEKVQISDKLSEDCQDFLKKCLTMIPECRPNLMELRRHPWLR